MFTVFKMPLCVAAVSLTQIFAVTPVFAQINSDAVRNSFTPDYFVVYAPQTALDMVSRIPGFQIESSDSRRGLGQGGANVLINGSRLTGKADPFDQLALITAKNVVRIEIADGASLDIPGLSGQVVNIVTLTTGVTGTWEWSPQFRKGLEPNWFNAEATLSGETGDLSYSFKLRDFSSRNGSRGPETITDASGIVFETRDEDGQWYGDRPGASVNLTYTPKDGHVANLNAEYNKVNFNGREVSIRTAQTPRGKDLETRFDDVEDEQVLEIGTDYQFPLGPGDLKLIGFYRNELSPSFTAFEVFDPIGSGGKSKFVADSDETEIIARTEYSWAPKEGQDWQIGLEGAFNTLDRETQFLERVGGVMIGVEPDRIEVKEDRGELTLTHSRSLSPKWDVQASIGGEYSKLTQTDFQTVTMNSREFVRPKGFLSATYKADDSLSINAKLEREVGQLDFFDFTSTVSLQDDLDRTGNPNIVPEQSWLGELEFDKDFGQGNTFKARFYGALISDIVDRIPIGLTGDAVGNIDSAYRYGVDFSSTIKGERWGLPGTELKLELELRDSSVDDPLLGFARRLNADKKVYYSFDFRHDIPNTNWAYGVFADRFIEADLYRLSTVQKFTFTRPFTIIFIEHKDIAGLKVNLSLRNVLNSGERFERTFYDARRDLGQIERIEKRERKFDPFVRLSVSGTF